MESEAFKKLLDSIEGTLLNIYKPPQPFITPTGIKHLDALLGGGIVSSGLVVLTSTPETGKSTFAYQVMKMFQDHHIKNNGNPMGFYFDTEGASSSVAVEDGSNLIAMQDRFKSFGIDSNRFRYVPLQCNLKNLFDNIFTNCIEVKRRLEEETNEQIQLIFVWDSITATPASTYGDAEDPNKVIGSKARELSFLLEKYMDAIVMNRVTLLVIDQVRANMRDLNPYAVKERSVGEFKDFRAATNILALSHRTQQWLFLSKKKEIVEPSMNINGWYLDIFTEKNKLAPSGYSVRCVFDKRRGIDKFWSEFTFLSELTATEEKYYRNKKIPFDLPISSNGRTLTLTVVNPETGEVIYESPSFYRTKALELYENDDKFREMFDLAVNLSVKERIYNGYFNIINNDTDFSDTENSESPEVPFSESELKEE